MTPIIRLHPEDGVVIARSTLLPGAEVAPGGCRGRAHSGGAQGGGAGAGARRPRCAATARSSASPPSRSSPAQHVHVHNMRHGRLRQGLRLQRRTPARRRWPTKRAQLPGHPSPGRPVRDAQLYRHPDLGELQRPHRAAHRRPVQAQPVHRRRPAGRVAQRRRGGGADPQDRLRHDRRRAAAAAAPHAGRLRAACELQPYHRDRARLRGEPDRRPARGAAPRRPGPQHGHPDHGRHPQDGRRPGSTSCARCWTRPTWCVASRRRFPS